ncbi:hypothetical protein ACOSQ2_007861 [Xanthoceras sorbifolium]
MEVEDDLFFADLSRQISLLIMDDDDHEDPVARCPTVSFQPLSRANYPNPTAPSPFYCHEQSCRRESKGTGVFIPQSSQPRRNNKNRQGRFSSFNTKSHHSKQHDHHKTTSVSQAASHNHSFNTKKG